MCEVGNKDLVCLKTQNIHLHDETCRHHSSGGRNEYAVSFLSHLRDNASELLLSDPERGGRYGSSPLRVKEVVFEEVLEE